MKRMPLKFRIPSFTFAILVGIRILYVDHARASLLVLPNYATNSQTANSGDAMFATAGRAQTVFGASEFPSYPILITKIQWRPDSITGGPITNGVITNIQINLSTTTNSADHLNSVFAQNTGTNDTVVFNGTLNLTTSFTALSNGTTEFDINLPLQTPFVYDPSKGNLLLDVRNFTGCTENIYDNAMGNESDSVSRVFSGNAQATTADVADTGGGAIQITYTAVTTVIIAQPTNQTTSINGTVTFIVTAVGAQPLNYQWFFNSLTNPIVDATNRSLALANVQTNQNGFYFVQVAGSSGSTLSSNALLTVIATPFISSQPSNQIAVPGGTATFTVAAMSGVPATFQWYYNDTELISGETNAALAVTNVQINQLGLYSVQVSNAYGSVTSSNALLSFGLIVPNYSATNQISAADNGFGSVSREDTVYAASEFPPYPIEIGEIRLRPDVGINGPLSTTLPSMQLSLSTTQAKPDQMNPTISQNIGTNSILVFSGALSISSSFTTLPNGTKSFDIRVPLQTSFLYDPAKGNLLLDFRNFSGCTPAEPSFINIAGGADSTSRIYTSDPNGDSALGDTGGYVLEIAYRPAPVPPTITSQPTNHLVAAGGDTTFSVTGFGAPPLSYQWYINDFDHPIDAATNSSLALVNVQTNQAGNYFVQLTDPYGSVQTTPAILEVAPMPLIITQPLSQTVTSGGIAIFSVAVEGAQPVNYQWFFNVTNRIPGATNAFLLLTNIQANHVGLYSVQIANIFGSTNSSNARLSIGLIVPNYAENFQLDNSGENLFVGIVREQTIYGAAHFPAYPIVITELRWRPDAIAGGPLTDNIPNIQINLSTTATNADHMSATFSKNIGTNDTVVFVGTMTGLTSFATLTNGTKAFDISLPLQIPFIFDASKGNLLVDIRNLAGGTANLYNNAVGTSTDTVSRIFAANANATSATAADSGGGALQIIFTPAPLPPTISSQPTNRTAVVGNTTAFNVVAGPLPLTYQWFYNTNTLLSGETNASLLLTNVQFAQSGTYSVVVSNSYGPTTSALAVLTATFPPVNVFLGSTNAMGGNSFTVPVLLAANGNENSLSFSLNFNTQRVTYASVDLGSGAADGFLIANTSEAVSGRLGVTMQLPPGETFAPGTQEVVRVTFGSTIVSGTQLVSPINFTNSPIPRSVADAQNNNLATNFINGSVTLALSDFEGDVTPRQTGDRNLDIFDWTQVGRFVAGLDIITNASEFQRADVAPKSTSGDGQLKVNDWVQAARYGGVLDAPVVVGGPTAPVAPTTLTGGPRTLNIAGGTGVKGLNITVPVILQSQGNENGIGFSVNFDPTILKYVSTVKGSADSSASLLVNTNQAASGTVGVLLALQTGNSFTNGVQEEVARLTFTALNSASNGAVAFGNGPVLLAVSDPLASELAANYSNGAVTINPPPTLTASFSGSNATLAWPVWGTGFNVQATGDLLKQGWTNVAYTAQTNGNNIVITIPPPSQGGYFRLQHP